MLILATGGDSLQVMQDYDTVSALLAGPSNEVTNTGYARKTLTDADLAAWAPDDTNNRTLLTLPLQTFGSPNIAAGDVWDIAVVAYDPDTTAGTDTTLVPITASETRIEATAIPGVGQPIIVDFSGGWAVAA